MAGDWIKMRTNLDTHPKAVSIATALQIDELPATAHSGTVRDAILFSLGCDDRHGLRRKNLDKRRLVTTMLAG